MNKTIVRVLVTVAVVAACWAPPGAAQQRTTFVAVDQEDQATSEADELLLQRLAAKLDEPLRPSTLGYEQAIDQLSERGEDSRDVRYLGHVTPYVYLAAEMLGADFEVLGTYVSKATKGTTTYHSYFVVNRAAIDSTLQLGGKRPDLDKLLEFVRVRAAAGTPARFVYHNRFSTSSYLLPSLFFRGHGVFSMRASAGSLTAIDSRWVGGDRETASSTALVGLVAAGERADLAAVWDGTKVKFEPGGDHAALGEQVYFIQLPTVLPNDLLVCSRSMLPREGAATTARSMVDKLFPPRPGGNSREPLTIGRGDFISWVPMDAEAQYALSGLRMVATEQRAPLTVSIAAADSKVAESYLQAARTALRLSGTELVPYDDSFHRVVDYAWTLAWVRDGYVILNSDIPAFGVAQEFPISFRPAARGAEESDLTQRIANIVSSRLHRIRYVWPYEEEQPLVIRDVPFAPGSAVKVQRIHWTEPARNGYTADNRPSSVAVEGDLFKFRLSKDAFRIAMADTNGLPPLDPMSTVAYRVVLQRPEEPRAMHAFFNGVFVLFLLVAVVGTVLALRGARRLARVEIAPSAALSNATR
ncbi:MAG TPA: hypothetical protein VN811_04900 [Thermoanaerobaculia bacterium]|nr:hypothetical protein [Thermoanaerobaculia bacterium]HXT50356.1 hypothetical protein [Thermoanaerobaculia bacterium]